MIIVICFCFPLMLLNRKMRNGAGKPELSEEVRKDDDCLQKKLILCIRHQNFILCRSGPGMIV